MRLTTGQARTRVLGMTFRPGPSPLGGPRPNSTKDCGERGQHPEKTLARSRRKGTTPGFEGQRGQHPEKTLARTRGKGTTPGFEGQAGSYIMAQKRTGGSHFGAVTSPWSPHSDAHCQSASTLSSRYRCLVAATRHVATM